MWTDAELIKNELCVLLSAIISMGAIILTNSMLIHVLILMFFSLIMVIIVGFDLIHPYFWFSAFFCLYSIGYPIIIYLGRGKARIPYSKETMIYQLLALTIALVVITPKKNEQLDEADFDTFKIDIGFFNWIIYACLIVLITTGGIIVVLSGFSGKDDVYASGNILLKMIFRLPLILAILYTVSVSSNYAKTKEFPLLLATITAGALIVITIFSGERDFVFRFLILNVFMLWSFKIIRLGHLMVFGPICAALVPLSSKYKYYFLRGSASSSNNNILVSFLSGEFESASRNLQETINSAHITKGVMGYKQLMYDLLSSVNRTIGSTTSWFNHTFYANSPVEYGFSLVGEGFLIGGAVGIIVIFIIVGASIKWFYQHADRNVFFYSAYLYYATIIIYAIRADLGTIVSGIAKQIILVLSVIILANKFSETR